jgi:hypothetical protein
VPAPREERISTFPPRLRARWRTLASPDGTYRTGMNFTQNGNATFAMFQLISWNRNGTQVFSQYTR